MKSLLISFFGSRNLGDLIISRQLAAECSEFSAVATQNYGWDAQNFSDIECIPLGSPKRRNPLHFAKEQLINILATTPLLEPVEELRIATQQTPTVRREFDDLLRRQLKAADFMVIGGGNMIFDTTPRGRSARQFMSYIDAAQSLGKPIYATSLGIGPFATQQQEASAARALERCQYVSFRDRQSQLRYERNSSHRSSVVVPDPAFLLPTLKLRRGTDNKGTVGLNLIDTRLAGSGPFRFRQHLKTFDLLVGKLSAEFHNVILYSTDMADYELLRKVAQRQKSRNVELHITTGLADLMHLYSQLDVVVAARMHSLITAYTQLIPCVGLVWQPKITGFFDQIARPELAFSLNDGDRIINKVVKDTIALAANSSAESQLIASRLRELRARRNVNRDILSRLANEAGRT